MIIYRVGLFYEQRAWEAWVSAYPHMSKKNFTTYDYIKRRKEKQFHSRKSTEELLIRAEKIRKKFKEARMLKEGGE